MTVYEYCAWIRQSVDTVVRHYSVSPPSRPEEAALKRRLRAIAKSTDALVPPSKHGIAAANLHGQEFGFTHDDVQALELLREKVGHVNDRGPHGEGWQSDALAAAWIRVESLTERLAALLPPRSP